MQHFLYYLNCMFSFIKIGRQYQLTAYGVEKMVSFFGSFFSYFVLLQ